MKNINKFNNWLAVKISKGVATMWCAYIFAVLAILGFPYHNLTFQTFIQWTSQTFIQLTMLAILAVGQNLLSSKHDQTQELLKRHHNEKMKKLDEIQRSINKK
jgi:hypothetical protein